VGGATRPCDERAGSGDAVIHASAPCALVNECFGATSEQRRPNTTENRASSSTRRRSQALRNRTLYGLQNLDPRFKSGRRLQNHQEICVSGRLPVLVIDFLLLLKDLKFADRRRVLNS